MTNRRSGEPLRVTILGYPAWGHTRPALRLAQRLLARGCRVDYWSLEPFRAAIEAARLRFRPYPDAAQALVKEGGLGDRLVALAATAPLLLAPLQAALTDDLPDLLIHDSLAIWGAVLAERLGRPHAASVTTFAFNRSMIRLLGAEALLAPQDWAMIARSLAELDATAFAAPTDLLLPRGPLKLVFTSRAFQPGGRGFDATHLFIGPMLEEAAADLTEPRHLAYVSMGTLFNRNRGVFEACLAYFRRSGQPALISLGGGLLPETFNDIPPNCDVVTRCDQPAVLRRARLFVTHGGMNSVSEALIAGVPMVVIPQDADQMLVARQVEALGCGVLLPQPALSETTLATCIARVADDQTGFQNRCRAVARSFARPPEQEALIDQLTSMRCLSALHSQSYG